MSNVSLLNVLLNINKEIKQDKTVQDKTVQDKTVQDKTVQDKTVQDKIIQDKKRDKKVNDWWEYNKSWLSMD